MVTKHIQQSASNASRLLAALPRHLADDTASWQAIICAARNCGVDWAAICDWSETNRYRDRNQVMRALSNLRSEAGIGTLIHYAGTVGIKPTDLGLETGGAKQQRAEFPAPCAPRPERRIVDGRKALESILKSTLATADELDLWERSPCRLDWPVWEDAEQLLVRLYNPTDRLFIGTRYDSGPRHVKTVPEWCREMRSSPRSGLPKYELIQPNPHAGRATRAKSGKVSWRCDACVADFRFAVVEFDSIGFREQLAFWIRMVDAGWPVAAIIHSGNRSAHGWVRVACTDHEEWETQVEERLFEGYLKPLGVDSACRNESRLSRLPGHYRAEKGAWQRLLYLNPEPRMEVA